MSTPILQAASEENCLSEPPHVTPLLFSAVTGFEEQQGGSILNTRSNVGIVTLTNSTATLETVDGSENAPPVLLREWQQQQSSPPVAPAVVMEDGHRRTSSSSSTNFYPVATFVRDLVRTGMDQISHVATTYPSIIVAAGNHHQHLSVRSEADVDALADAVRSYALAQADTPRHHIALSVPRSMNNNDFFDADDGDSTEYVLVDGELIALPTPHPRTEQSTVEDLLRRQREMDGDDDRRQTCQTPHPHRIKRGVRKISKFFKRVRRGKSRSRDGAVEAAAIGEAASARSSVAAGASLDEGAQLQLQNLDREEEEGQASTPKRGKKGFRRQRRSWKRKEKDAMEQEQERGPCSAMTSEIRASPRPSLGTAMTGLEAPSFTINDQQMAVPSPDAFSRRRRNNNHVDQDPLSPPAAYPSAPYASPIQESEGYRTQSVTASFVGTTDQLEESGWDSGILPADVAAITFIESEDLSYWKKDDGSLIPSVLSVVPPDADYKVDKADAPDFESMLMRAAHETTLDLDSSDIPTLSLGAARCKSDGSTDSVPLSQARHADIGRQSIVYNDMLKVVMVAAPGVDKTWVARSLRNSRKQPRKRVTLGVDVHSWSPTPTCAAVDDEVSDDVPTEPVKFMIWDVQGATGCPLDSANFGAHPGTQSLFFSDRSLYLLCWDLACSNPKTYQRPLHVDQEDDDDDDDEEECEGYTDAFVREEANRRADRALLADISQRVLSWVDTIARCGPNSAILPVAIVPPDMSETEAKRRCEMMQQALVQHNLRYEGDLRLPILLSGADNETLSVNRGSGEGIDKLQETVLAIGTDASKSVFDHVGTQVPDGTVEVLELIRGFKEQHKLILLDHLLGAIGESMEVDQVLKALQFLSYTGEILFYLGEQDHVLSRFIVLSRKWLVSALSCILRNDLKRELSEVRRFMNMQCIYSDHKFTESQVIRTLVSGTMSSCPLLSDNDSQMLWQSMSFMREAADHYSQLSESSTSTPTMFYFLERLLVHKGIFLPLECSSDSSLERSAVFFVPSLLAQADPREVWSYKSSESWTTTLCHSWLFRDGVPSTLMERLTVKVLSDLYSFAQNFRGGVEPGDGSPPERARTVPLRLSSLNEFMENHDSEALGRVKIHQIVCWNSSLLVKIGTVFADPDRGELRESFVEIFVAIVDQSASHCVASDAMRASMQRVVVSGKGQVGHHGRKIWKGGYDVILKSVRESLSDFSNVDSQVICPECLAHSNPGSASTWSWDSVYALAHTGEPVVRCMRGHRVDSNLICGTCAERKPAPVVDPSLSQVGSAKPVSEILPSVVLVGLWDTQAKVIRSIGSGFVVDRKLGLIVTAGHILFNIEGRRTDYGLPYLGIKDAKVVIGVIPEGHTARFRYFGEIVVDDIHYVDACVVRITTRMEQDVDGDGAGCADQPEQLLPLDAIPSEQLRSLKMTSRFELEERVRVLGYNQGGEGVYEQGTHVNRCADFASGYICRVFQAPIPDDSSSSDSSSHMSFSPREEVVVMCPTISGHSGGPCVNNDGKVIGILSRADPVDRQRCYLVPASELRPLVTKAKKLCTPRANLTSLTSM